MGRRQSKLDPAPTAETINRDQLLDLLAYARRIGDGRLAACCMRALDGDSMYDSAIRERCAATYASARGSREFAQMNRTKERS